MASTSSDNLQRTPLFALHQELGGRIVPFAGYEMPVQYEGILAEHNWTRENAGLFDVSHMGQRGLVGPDHETTAAALEALTPGDFKGLGLGRIRYTLLLTDAGTIIDDLMVTRPLDPAEAGRLFLIVNAARKAEDDARIASNLPAGVVYEKYEDRALLALQGPKAVDAFARHCPAAAGLGFMTATVADFDGIPVCVSRSGYTGEDGFEISVPAELAERVARALLAEPEVRPIGLGARDSLRLEAGLCLYGHDIDETTTPVEADLGFALSKRRREEGGFPGAAIVQGQLAGGTARRRVGIKPEGRAPARDGTAITDKAGNPIGTVTSGGFGPTVGGPIAMGYVATAFAEPGSAVDLVVRGKPLPATVVAMPFVTQRYYRKPKASAASS